MIKRKVRGACVSSPLLHEWTGIGPRGDYFLEGLGWRVTSQVSGLFSTNILMFLFHVQRTKIKARFDWPLTAPACPSGLSDLSLEPRPMLSWPSDPFIVPDDLAVSRFSTKGTYLIPSRHIS